MIIAEFWSLYFTWGWGGGRCWNCRILSSRSILCIRISGSSSSYRRGASRKDTILGKSIVPKPSLSNGSIVTDVGQFWGCPTVHCSFPHRVFLYSSSPHGSIWWHLPTRPTAFSGDREVWRRGARSAVNMTAWSGPIMSWFSSWSPGTVTVLAVWRWMSQHSLRHHDDISNISLGFGPWSRADADGLGDLRWYVDKSSINSSIVTWSSPGFLPPKWRLENASTVTQEMKYRSLSYYFCSIQFQLYIPNNRSSCLNSFLITCSTLST